VINRRGPWPGVFMEEPGVPPTTAHETASQIVLAHAIIGLINASVFRAIRRLPSSTLQEKIAKSLFIPLAIGDVTYLLGTFYGIGDVRWKSSDWPQTLWLNVIVGVGFFIPRCIGTIPSQITTLTLTPLQGLLAPWYRKIRRGSRQQVGLQELM